MYQTQILKDIISKKDLKAISKVVPLSKHVFPTEDVHAFFEFIYGYVMKFGDIPTESYITSFLAGERNSPISDVWNSLAEVAESKDDILAMIELQAIYSTRSKVIGLSHGVLNNLKLSNNSESTAIVTSFKESIDSVVSTQNKLFTKQEVMSGENAVHNLKMYHEQSNSQGYFLSKYDIPFIDDSWGGMERSGFIGILASAKQYKSTLMRFICYKQLMQGISVGIITLEMPMESVREHFYCIDVKSIIDVKYNNEIYSIEIGAVEQLLTQHESIEVFTPDGWVKITQYLPKGIKDTIKLELEDGKQLICTPDHKIETSNRGWVEAQYLTEDDDIVVGLSSF